MSDEWREGQLQSEINSKNNALADRNGVYSLEEYVSDGRIHKLTGNNLKYSDPNVSSSILPALVLSK